MWGRENPFKILLTVLGLRKIGGKEQVKPWWDAEISVRIREAGDSMEEEGTELWSGAREE